MPNLLAARLEPYDYQTVSELGREVAQRLAAVTKKQLKLIQDADTDEPGAILQAMIEAMSSLRFDHLDPGGFLASLPFIGELISNQGRIDKRFRETRAHLRNLMAELRAQEARVRTELEQLEGLSAEIADILADSETSVRAAKALLTRLRTESEQAPPPGDDLHACEQASDRRRAIDHLERRRDQLRITRISAIQGATQVRLARDMRHGLLLGIRELLQNSLPLWERQFLIAGAKAEMAKPRGARVGPAGATDRVPIHPRVRPNPSAGILARAGRKSDLTPEVMKELTRQAVSAIQDKLERFKELTGMDRE